ncbi:MAG: hypothetical protein N2444_00375 [Methylocystis sp.]|nr:hypothetical protein [Methylocystis sp.]
MRAPVIFAACLAAGYASAGWVQLLGAGAGTGGAPPPPDTSWTFTDGVKTRTLSGGTYQVHVIYGGWNLRLSAAGTVEGLIAAAVASVPGGARCLVLGVPTFESSDDYAGAAGHEAVLTINRALDEAYGLYWASSANCAYVDFREHFVGSYSPTSAQDVTDFGRDIIPTSMRSGATAFSAGGVSAIDAWLAAIISEKGW